MSLFLWFIGLLAILQMVVLAVVYLRIGHSLVALKQLGSKLGDIKSIDDRSSFKQEWPVEFSPIVAIINDLLSRLHRDFGQERRFTASVAHELRTPIAELQLATDVALMASSQTERMQVAVVQANTLAGRMENIVNALSMLFRYQSREQGLCYESCDVVALIGKELKEKAQIVKDRKISVKSALPARYLLCTDVTILHSVICNLIKNAIAYAPKNTEIEIVLDVDQQDSGKSTLRISNIAPQINQDELNDMFAPFWRKEHDSVEGKNLGLGLAIAKEASQKLGYSLNAKKLKHERIEFSLSVQPNLA